MSVKGRPSTGAPLKPVELVRAGSVARRYFVDRRSKSQIAGELGISRFKVARILEQAQRSGLVRIEIGLPAELDAGLSDRLRAAFGLHHALVITTPDEPEAELRQHLGEVAAGLLSEIVVEGDVLGIGWGRTLTSMASVMTGLARCTVVQLTGAVGVVHVRDDSVEMVRAVADVCGGPAFPIYAPFVLDDPQAAAAMRRQPHVAEALRRFDLLTKAVVAVGSWDPPNSQLRDSLSREDLAALLPVGVRAELCATLVNDDGVAVAPELSDRSIAVTGAQLRRVPEVIAVAGGRRKALAVRAVLRAGLVTSLVTDVSVARVLLDEDAGDP